MRDPHPRARCAPELPGGCARGRPRRGGCTQTAPSVYSERASALAPRRRRVPAGAPHPGPRRATAPRPRSRRRRGPSRRRTARSWRTRARASRRTTASALAPRGELPAHASVAPTPLRGVRVTPPGWRREPTRGASSAPCAEASTAGGCRTIRARTRGARFKAAPRAQRDGCPGRVEASDGAATGAAARVAPRGLDAPRAWLRGGGCRRVG